jgi:hypothetical protein
LYPGNTGLPMLTYGIGVLIEKSCVHETGHYEKMGKKSCACAEEFYLDK